MNDVECFITELRRHRVDDEEEPTGPTSKSAQTIGRGSQVKSHNDTVALDFYTTLRFVAERTKAARDTCELFAATGPGALTEPIGKPSYHRLHWETRRERMHYLFCAVEAEKARVLPHVRTELALRNR